MKKMLCIMLSLIMVLGLLSGCDSLFTSGDEGGAAGGSNGDIKMTDKYTFTDPTDLTFETRYALYCDENSAVVSTAASYGVEYCPLVFPGFSDRNMHPDHTVYDRHSGDFYWQQIHKFINQGATMLYVAMFDEIDEGTAIYKCLRKNEVPSNEYSKDYYVVFENGAYRRSDEPVTVSGNGWCRKASELGVTFNGIENNLGSDYYLKLTGEAGKILKGQAKLTSNKPF